ncbi:MAG TPA: hypothetical protein V6C97_16380 [Oculatellaceae cyanobacterium]
MQEEEQRLKDALRAAEVRYGPNHVQTGFVLVQLAEFYLLHERHAESNECQERVRLILDVWLKEHRSTGSDS